MDDLRESSTVSSNQDKVVLQRQILQARGPRANIRADRVIDWSLEEEAASHNRLSKGKVAKVLTLLLAAKECPWRCVMCDLWKNTLVGPTPVGAIPQQIEEVLGQAPRADWIKLYNAGSFFDQKSIPPVDYGRIAALCNTFQRVIIENHPRLCGPSVADFQQLLGTQLEVALGVETVQPGMLRRLNKGMSREHVDKAILFLRQQQIDVRAFVLIQPPWTTASEAVRWGKLTVLHLVRLGVRHISLIPVRSGNGWMEQLQARGEFAAPSLETIEMLMDELQELSTETVLTLDLWDWGSLVPRHTADCPRRRRLAAMNVTQTPQPAVRCACNELPDS